VFWNRAALRQAEPGFRLSVTQVSFLVRRNVYQKQSPLQNILQVLDRHYLNQKRERRWLIPAHGWSAATTVGNQCSGAEMLKAFATGGTPSALCQMRFDNPRVVASVPTPGLKLVSAFGVSGLK